MNRIQAQLKYNDGVRNLA